MGFHFESEHRKSVDVEDAPDRFDGVDEKVKAYGYTDNGKEIDGYYVTTENYTFYFCTKGVFKRKELLNKK